LHGAKKQINSEANSAGAPFVLVICAVGTKDLTFYA